MVKVGFDSKAYVLLIIPHWFTLESLGVYFNSIPLFNRDGPKRESMRPRGTLCPEWAYGHEDPDHRPSLCPCHCCINILQDGRFSVWSVSHSLTLGESPVLSGP